VSSEVFHIVIVVFAITAVCRNITNVFQQRAGPVEGAKKGRRPHTAQQAKLENPTWRIERSQKGRKKKTSTKKRPVPIVHQRIASIGAYEHELNRQTPRRLFEVVVAPQVC